MIVRREAQSEMNIEEELHTNLLKVARTALTYYVLV